MGGRGRDTETGREVRRCSVKRRGGSGGRMGAPTIAVWRIQIGKDTCGASNPSPRPDCTAQGSSAGEILPPKFWLYKPVGVRAVEETAGFSRDSI